MSRIDRTSGQCVWINRACRLAEGDIVCELDVAPPGDQAEMAASLGTWMKSLPRDRYPNTLALAGKLATGTAEDRFEWGLA